MVPCTLERKQVGGDLETPGTSWRFVPSILGDLGRTISFTHTVKFKKRFHTHLYHAVCYNESSLQHHIQRYKLLLLPEHLLETPP